jgi:hypothetical protein
LDDFLIALLLQPLNPTALRCFARRFVQAARIITRRRNFAALHCALFAFGCSFAIHPVNLKFLFCIKDAQGMLLNRDLVGHMAAEALKKLVEAEMVEVKNPETVVPRLRQAMLEEITVEDRINEEARQILIQHQEQMRNSGISYQEMFKKVKTQLARDKKLVLR